MCAQCDDFHDSVRLASVAEYLIQVDRARAAIVEGTLDCLDSCPELAAMPGAVPAHCRHVFACSLCSQLFILEIGACDALGDQWRPLHGN